MHTIYAPWRKEYFGSQESSCVFCAISSAPDSDTQNRVFYRDDFCFCVMNRFPYTPGHFMLIPHAHCDSPELLDSKTWAHIQNLSQKAFGILYEYGASGINMGMNVKKAGGAGIPEHIHIHFVPRYVGDTNFMTSVANARTYGVDFDEVFETISRLANKHLKER